MKKYEAIIILKKQIEDADIDKHVEPVRKAVEKFEGDLHAVTRMGRLTFARPFKAGKYESGIYILLSFSMTPDKVESFKDEFKYNDDIVRIQIVKGDKAKKDKETQTA
ncbi:MAG: 30S ribosomal protein S6 [Lentisphaerae bacterium]|nr:30S ribosomal protein S6 [Lentisphaerota bacterium]